MGEVINHIGGGDDEELNRLLRILANPTRRALLQRLSYEEDDAVAIDDLCDGLGIEGDEVTNALYHVHLPLLSDAGVVDVDLNRRTVRYRDGHRIESLMNRLLDRSEA